MLEAHACMNMTAIQHMPIAMIARRIRPFSFAEIFTAGSLAGAFLDAPPSPAQDRFRISHNFPDICAIHPLLSFHITPVNKISCSPLLIGLFRAGAEISAGFSRLYRVNADRPPASRSTIFPLHAASHCANADCAPAPLRREPPVFS